MVRTGKASRRGRPRDAELPRRRREEILERAALRFAEHGYAATDVQHLADDLGIGKGTVYRYFPSKRALFLAATDRGMRLLHERVEEGSAGARDPLEQVRYAIRAYLSFFDSHPEYAELLIQERAAFRDRKVPTYFAHHEARIGKWQRLMQGLIAAGRVRAMPVERILSVASDLLYGTMLANHFTGRRASFEEQAESLLDVMFHGILVGRERARRGRRA